MAKFIVSLLFILGIPGTWSVFDVLPLNKTLIPLLLLLIIIYSICWIMDAFAEICWNVFVDDLDFHYKNKRLQFEWSWINFVVFLCPLIAIIWFF